MEKSEKDVGFERPPSNDSSNVATVDENEKLGFWTRMGVTPESFMRRKASKDDNLLN